MGHNGTGRLKQAFPPPVIQGFHAFKQACLFCSCSIIWFMRTMGEFYQQVSLCFLQSQIGIDILDYRHSLPTRKRTPIRCIPIRLDTFPNPFITKANHLQYLIYYFLLCVRYCYSRSKIASSFGGGERKTDRPFTICEACQPSSICLSQMHYPSLLLGCPTTFGTTEFLPFGMCRLNKHFLLAMSAVHLYRHKPNVTWNCGPVKFMEIR